MLSLYSIFHGNLQFSSIPRNDYKTVIDNCYWPLIKLVENNEKLKLGIEFSALTLLEIKRIDPGLIIKIKKLIEDGRLEFIGSGYTQAIFPLIPYEVNLKNIELGIQIYKNILGSIPKIFYVNEQTFSDGLISVYKAAGIKNIVVDFDSAPEEIRFKKLLLYRSVKLVSKQGSTLNAIWGGSIAFQKFQRYVFDEISFEDYRQYLFNHLNSRENRYFPLYTGDWEIFGYSPKGIKRNFKNDYMKMQQIFDRFLKEKQINFVLPSKVLANNLINPTVRFVDPSSPISSKKQEKYNVSRWALAGKNTIFRNTDCFKLYRSIKTLKDQGIAGTSIIECLERNLIVLWGSDYRTNTTEDKNNEYSSILAKTQKTIKKYTDNYVLQIIDSTNSRNNYQITTEESWVTENVRLTLDQRKGACITELVFPKIFPKKMVGLAIHGYFQDQRLSSDWFSGHCLFETDNGKYTDLSPTKIYVNKNRKGDINLFCKINTPIGEIRKIYKIYRDLPRVDLKYEFNLKKTGLKSARIGNVTLDPLNFSHSSFWYATVNGGKSEEVYRLSNALIAHDEIVSFRISSRGCLGTTEGWLAIGDKHKALALTWDKGELASCPIVHFEKTQQGLFARVQPSIAESDETGFPVFKGKFSFGISYLGLKSPFELDRLNASNRTIKK